jgi:hypothetical protein
MLESNTTTMVARMVNRARKTARSLAMNLKIAVKTVRIISLLHLYDIAKISKL